jgi:hypothetical protein
MSSIVERLTEGVVNRDMRAESHALLSKWKKTGLLEGLDSERQQNTMSRLLENQAKELLREQTTIGAGSVEGFAAVAFPIVRRVFAGLIANDLVSVQPMSLPSGLIFFLDFTFSGDAGGTDGGMVSPRMGNTKDKSIYGTDQVGAAVIDGVDLVNATNKSGFSGPGRDGQTGYAYASPSGSLTDPIATSEAKYITFLLDGAVSQANKKRVLFDPDLLSVTDSSLRALVVDIDKAQVVSATGDPDFDNLSAFVMDLVDFVADFDTGVAATTNVAQLRRLTTLVSATEGLNGEEAVRLVQLLLSILLLPVQLHLITRLLPHASPSRLLTSLLPLQFLEQLVQAATSSQWKLRQISLRSTSRLIQPRLPLRPRSLRLSGPQSLVRTSTHTTTWMPRLNLPQFSPSRLLLRLTVRFLLTLLTVPPQLPATGHALPVSSLTLTVTS